MRDDVGGGKGPLKKRYQSTFHGDCQAPLRSHGTGHVGQDIGEHHLVAQPLLGADQQSLSVQRCVGHPSRKIDRKARRGVERGVEAGLIDGPSRPQRARREVNGRDRERHGRTVGVAVRGRQGRVAIGQGAKAVAQIQASIGAIVACSREVRRQPQRLVKEGQRLVRLALAAQHGAQGVPQQGLIGLHRKRRSQEIDGLVAAIEITQGAGQVVENFRVSRLMRQRMLKELGGGVDHVQPVRQASKIAGHRGFILDQFDRGFVTLKRAGEVPELFPRHAQHVPCETQLGVAGQGGERQSLGPLEMARAQSRDRAVQTATRDGIGHPMRPRLQATDGLFGGGVPVQRAIGFARGGNLNVGNLLKDGGCSLAARGQSACPARASTQSSRSRTRS